METEKNHSRYSYYDVLEVSPLSQQHEITTAYERARTTYSGQNPAVYTIFSEAEARELLRLVEEAYSVIGNKTLRALYDEKLDGGRFNLADINLQALQIESKSRSLANQVPKKLKVFQLDHPVDTEFESEIKSTTDWNGGFLKKVREYKQVSVEKMSEITKVSGYYINAIENMDPEHLPAKVFVRGYVAQICRVLLLNEKTVCDSYMAHFGKLNQ